MLYSKIPDDWRLPLHVVLDLEVSKEDDSSIAGQEDENVPGSVKVGEPWQVFIVDIIQYETVLPTYRGPPRAEQAVIDPASNGQAPQEDGPVIGY